MRNLTIYLMLSLCLFASKILAQDSIPKKEQEEQTFEQAWGQYEIKREKIKQEEEKIYNEEINKLKIQRKKGILSKREFKNQEVALEKKKNSNIKEKGDLDYKKIVQQFPDMGAKSFKYKSARIIDGMKYDIYVEKQLLKTEIETLDKQLIEGTITKKQAEAQKLQLAETRAKAIESKVAEWQKVLSVLAQDEMDGKLPKDSKKGLTITIGGNNNSDSNIGSYHNLAFPAMKAYNGQKDKDRQQNKRTSSQVVFAMGLNNVVTDKSIKDSDFNYLQSRFYEWGFTFNSRIISNNNLLHAKYGLSLMYNDLKPTDNRFFVDNGSQTVLVTNPLHQENFRFRNVNLVFPLHLEFDFTKPKLKGDKTYFKSHNSFRLGIGGFVGANVKSKQKINYDLNGYDRADKTKGVFNTNDFVYGLSSYVGYGATSLYLKYDLNTLFKNNPVKQNNVSLGVRFDFN